MSEIEGGPENEKVVMEGIAVAPSTSPPQMNLALDLSEPSPAPALEATVASPTTPDPPAPPAPSPPPTPAPKKRKTRADVDRLLQELEATKVELDQAKAEHLAQAEKIRGEMESRRDEFRLESLRRMGAKGDLTDAQLLQLAPVVDAKSPEGRSRLDEWKAANPRLFNQVEGSIQDDPHKFLSQVRSSPFGTFGPHTAQAMIDHIFADGKK